MKTFIDKTNLANYFKIIQRLLPICFLIFSINMMAQRTGGAGSVGGSGSSGGGEVGGTQAVNSITGEAAPCPETTNYEYKLIDVSGGTDWTVYSYSWSAYIINNGGIYYQGSVSNSKQNPCYVTWSKPTNDASSKATIACEITFYKEGNKDANGNLQEYKTITSTKSIVIKYLPDPGTITGPNWVAPGNTTVTKYEIAAVSNATSYSWTLPQGWAFQPNTDQTKNTVYVIAPSAGKSGNICVAAKNSTCTMTSNLSCIFVKNENDKPVINPNTKPGTVCTTAPHDYTLSIPPVAYATGYLWSVSGTGASIPGDRTTTSVILHTDANINGNATVTVTAYFAYNRTTQDYFTFSMTNQTPGQPELDGDYMGCASGAHTKIYVLNPPSYPVSYRWTWSPTSGIKVIAAGNGATVLPNSPGMYNIYATPVNACGTGTKSELYPYDVLNCNRTTAVENNTVSPKEISFYPNPASNSFELIVPSKGTSQVKLISVTGQVVKQIDIHDQKNTINVSDIAPGLYILNVVSDGELLNKQIEITK